MSAMKDPVITEALAGEMAAGASGEVVSLRDRRRPSGSDEVTGTSEVVGALEGQVDALTQALERAKAELEAKRAHLAELTADKEHKDDERTVRISRDDEARELLAYVETAQLEAKRLAERRPRSQASLARPARLSRQGSKSSSKSSSKVGPRSAHTNVVALEDKTLEVSKSAPELQREDSRGVVKSEQEKAGARQRKSLAMAEAALPSTERPTRAFIAKLRRASEGLGSELFKQLSQLASGAQSAVRRPAAPTSSPLDGPTEPILVRAQPSESSHSERRPTDDWARALFAPEQRAPWHRRREVLVAGGITLGVLLLVMLLRGGSGGGSVAPVSAPPATVSSAAAPAQSPALPASPVIAAPKAEQKASAEPTRRWVKRARGKPARR